MAVGAVFSGVDTRRGSEASARARLLDEEWRSRPQSAHTIQKWDAESAIMSMPRPEEDILYRLVDLSARL